jgi:D-arabinose 1-dehydrogenase-like Zn-dependent alcohol dehydrogenase
VAAALLAGLTGAFAAADVPALAARQHAELIGLAACGLVQPVVTTFSLDQALGAYQRLEARHLGGRAVIVPSPA